MKKRFVKRYRKRRAIKRYRRRRGIKKGPREIIKTKFVFSTAAVTDNNGTFHCAVNWYGDITTPTGTNDINLNPITEFA